MSDFVLDTSVVMPWCFGDEANPLSDSLLRRLEAEEEATVPSLWPFEVSNALLSAKRKGRVTEAQILGFLEDLRSFRIRIDLEGQTRAFSDIRSLGEKYGITAYDAAYLELSMRTGVPLATLDEALKKAAAAAGAAVI